MDDLPYLLKETFEQSLVMVTAIIRRQQLDVVSSELDRAGIYGMTVSEVLGKGSERARTCYYRGLPFTPSLIPKVQIQIAVEEDLVDHVVSAILRSARSGGTGQVGDGKIFVTRIAEVIRIRTGQVNEAAL